MRQSEGALTVSTSGRGLTDVTAELASWVAAQGMKTGLLTVFCQHTSASLVIQENADPNVQRDLETFFRALVRDDATLYRHSDEGADDMPAHIRSALTAGQLSIPLSAGRLALGTWQAVYVFEHRVRPHRRRLALHLIGD